MSQVDLDLRRRAAAEAARRVEEETGVDLVTLKPVARPPAPTEGQGRSEPQERPQPAPPAAIPASAAPPPSMGYVPRRPSAFEDDRKGARFAPSGAELVPLTVMIPDYLLRQIEHAVSQNAPISKRFIVTDALSRAGFTVKPEDLVEDGRRRRRRRTV